MYWVLLGLKLPGRTSVAGGGSIFKAGLSLGTTQAEWTHGDGPVSHAGAVARVAVSPDVSGKLLFMASTGRDENSPRKRGAAGEVEFVYTVARPPCVLGSPPPG